MRYFLFIDKSGKRHILVADSFEQATSIAAGSIAVDHGYELLPNTFQQPGFLISD